LEFASEYDFVDLGEEEDDQGSADEEKEDDVREPSVEEHSEEEEIVESLNEAEPEEREPVEREASTTSLNAESMLQSFLANPTWEMFKKIEEERLKMIDYFDVSTRFLNFKFIYIF